MPPLNQVKPALLVANGLVNYCDFGIQFTRGEVVSRKLSLNHQANILQVCSRGLILRVGRFDVAADPAEQISFVVQGERNLKSTLRQRQAGVVEGRALALPLCSGLSAELRKQS